MQIVGARTAGQRIVSGQPQQRVVAAKTVDRIIARRTVDMVCAVGRGRNLELAFKRCLIPDSPVAEYDLLYPVRRAVEPIGEMNMVAGAIDGDENAIGIASHGHAGRHDIGGELQGVAVARRGIAIRDLVLPRTPAEEISVVPRSAGQKILASRPIQHIISAAASETIVAGPAGQLIVAAAPIETAANTVAGLQRIVACLAAENVVAIPAGKHVVPVAALQRIVARTRKKNVVAGAADQKIVAGAAQQRVVAGKSGNGVVTAKTVDRIVCIRSNDVIRAIGNGIQPVEDVVNAQKREIAIKIDPFDPGCIAREPVLHGHGAAGIASRQHQIIAVTRKAEHVLSCGNRYHIEIVGGRIVLDNDVVARAVEKIDVVTRPAQQHIVAAVAFQKIAAQPSVQCVIAARPEELIAGVSADQHVVAIGAMKRKREYFRKLQKFRLGPYGAVAEMNVHIDYAGAVDRAPQRELVVRKVYADSHIVGIARDDQVGWRDAGFQHH